MTARDVNFGSLPEKGENLKTVAIRHVDIEQKQIGERKFVAIGKGVECGQVHDCFLGIKDVEEPMLETCLTKAGSEQHIVVARIVPTKTFRPSAYPTT